MNDKIEKFFGSCFIDKLRFEKTNQRLPSVDKRENRNSCSLGNKDFRRLSCLLTFCVRSVGRKIDFQINFNNYLRSMPP